MGLSKEDRKLLYTKMYTAVSKATAETKNAKGESVKTTYNGTLANLFDEVCDNRRVITAFMWAITHKTETLPTQLFRAVDHGIKGYEISRIHSGFYDDHRNHIIGTALIPFIMEAIKLWTPTPRAKKEVSEEYPIKARIEDDARIERLAGRKMKIDSAGKCNTVPIEQYSDDELACFGKYAQERYDKAKADLEAYRAEVQRREQERKVIAKKQEVRKAIAELVESEGFTLDEILNI